MATPRYPVVHNCASSSSKIITTRPIRSHRYCAIGDTRCETVYDGPSGIEVASEFHPNAAIVDIGLPGMDGYGVARKLHDTPPDERPLLIAITGYGRDVDQKPHDRCRIRPPFLQARRSQSAAPRPR